jgi:hypothetical protein
MAVATETIELTCKSGHLSQHLLHRVLRLNDAWCGQCGADLPYLPRQDAVPPKPAADARVASGHLRIAPGSTSRS